MTDLRVRPPRVALLTRVVIASAAGLFILTPLHARTQNPFDSVRPQDFSSAPEQPDAWADDDIPAHISVVDGNATLERDARVEAAAENTPLLAGDRVRTDRGRVSILYADGSALDLDHFSNVDLLAESLLRLNSGRIRLAVVKVTVAQPLRVDGAGSTAWIQQPGEYRVSLGDPRVEFPEMTIATLRGSAELVSSAGRVVVRSGTAAATTSRAAPSAPWTINVSATDEFDRWSEQLRTARFGSTSIPYIPSELSAYSGTLDTSGTWDYEETYGYVWYPYVPIGWRPYCDGRWSFVGSFGWTWVGGPRWAYPTHHYGRWGHHARGWYWIPNNRWSPAWVSWAHAPGYVGWSPLGYDNRPVHGFGAYRGNPHWGWTILPSQSFASRAYVRDSAVSADRVPASTWSQFGRRAPARPSVTGINATPLRAPGVSTRGSAVPRGTIATPIPIGASRAVTTSAGIAQSPSGRIAPRTSGAAPAGYPATDRGGAAPYSRVAQPTPVRDTSGRAAPANTGRSEPPDYEVGPAAPRTGASAVPPGATETSGATGRVSPYPSARPTSPSPGDLRNIGGAQPRSRAGTPNAAPPSAGSAAPLPIMMRGTPPPRPPAPASEPDSGGSGRTGPDRPSAVGGAAPTGYGPSSARPRGGDSPSAAPSRERGGAPASAGPSRERGGAPAAATAAPARAGSAPTGRTVSRGRGGL